MICVWNCSEPLLELFWTYHGIVVNSFKSALEHVCVPAVKETSPFAIMAPWRMDNCFGDCGWHFLNRRHQRFSNALRVVSTYREISLCVEKETQSASWCDMMWLQISKSCLVLLSRYRELVSAAAYPAICFKISRFVIYCGSPMNLLYCDIGVHRVIDLLSSAVVEISRIGLCCCLSVNLFQDIEICCLLRIIDQLVVLRCWGWSGYRVAQA